MKAKTTKLNLQILEKADSIREKFIPLHLLLFNTGYFTMKRMLNENQAELDWTNEETKRLLMSIIFVVWVSKSAICYIHLEEQKKIGI